MKHVHAGHLAAAQARAFCFPPSATGPFSNPHPIHPLFPALLSTEVTSSRPLRPLRVFLCLPAEHAVKGPCGGHGAQVPAQPDGLLRKGAPGGSSVLLLSHRLRQWEIDSAFGFYLLNRAMDKVNYAFIGNARSKPQEDGDLK